MAVGTLTLTDGTITCTLTDGTSYNVLRGSLSFKREPKIHSFAGERRDGSIVAGRNWGDLVITMTVHVKGATIDASITNYRNLQTVLRTATTYSSRRWGRKVTLTYQPTGASNSAIYDVLTGDIPELEQAFDNVGQFTAVPLTLVCKPFARSTEAAVLAQTAVPNHQDTDHSNTIKIESGSILGDVPAETRLWFKSGSTSTCTFGTVRYGCFADVRGTNAAPCPVVEAETTASVGYGLITSDYDPTSSASAVLRIDTTKLDAIDIAGSAVNTASTADAAWQDFTSAFTLEGWIRPNAALANNPQCIVAKWDADNDDCAYALLVENKKPRLVMSSNGSTLNLDVRGGTTLTTGSWYWLHSEFLQQGNVRSGVIYLDGRVDGTSSCTVTVTACLLEPDASGASSNMTASGAANDYTCLNDGLDTTYLVASATDNWAYHSVGVPVFTGVGDDILNVSVHARYATLRWGGTSLWSYIRVGGTVYQAGPAYGAAGGMTWYDFYNTWYTNPQTGLSWVASDIGSIEIGVLSHVGSYYNADQKLYVSDMDLTINSYTASLVRPYAAATKLRLGTASSWGINDSIAGSTQLPFEGRIDEVRVSNSVMQSSRSAPQSELYGGEALYHLNEGTGTTLGDGSGSARDMAVGAGNWAAGAFTHVGNENWRSTYVIPEVLFESYPGWYDVYARTRSTTNTASDVQWRCRWYNGPWWTSYKINCVVPNQWELNWLGRIRMPWYSVQDGWVTDDVFGASAPRFFDLWTKHTAGSDLLEIDYFLFMPLEPWSGIVKNCDMGASQGILVSTADDQPWVGRTGSAYSVATPPQALDPQVVMPYLEPGKDHYIVTSVDRADGTNNAADVVDVTVRAMPRWLWVR